jgi:hypothetical protein
MYIPFTYSIHHNKSTLLLLIFPFFPSLVFRSVLFLQDAHFSIESAAYNLIYHLIPNSLFAVALYFWQNYSELSTINVTYNRYYWLFGHWHPCPWSRSAGNFAECLSNLQEELTQQQYQLLLLKI